MKISNQIGWACIIVSMMLVGFASGLKPIEFCKKKKLTRAPIGTAINVKGFIARQVNNCVFD